MILAPDRSASVGFRFFSFRLLIRSALHTPRARAWQPLVELHMRSRQRKNADKVGVKCRANSLEEDSGFSDG